MKRLLLALVAASVLCAATPAMAHGPGPRVGFYASYAPYYPVYRPYYYGPRYYPPPVYYPPYPVAYPAYPVYPGPAYGFGYYGPSFSFSVAR